MLLKELIKLIIKLSPESNMDKAKKIRGKAKLKSEKNNPADGETPSQTGKYKDF